LVSATAAASEGWFVEPHAAATNRERTAIAVRTDVLQVLRTLIIRSSL
jgi:hypothetical protein